MNSIVVSPEHKMSAPLVYNLGDHSLIITSDYSAPEAFELCAPVIHEIETGEAVIDVETSPKTAIFDHDETYRLYQCLHTLFHTIEEISE
jgi:hypothetical protein